MILLPRLIKMKKLLLVDDDEETLIAVEAFLTASGFACDCVLTGSDARRCMLEGSYAAIVLDWMLPDVSGYDLCLEYRQAGGQTPIIFLTGKDNMTALELALEAGGDDYISKPFDARELYARLKAVLRRKDKPYIEKLTIRNVSLHPENATLEGNGVTITLRNKEAAILEVLMSKANVAHSAQELLTAVWPADTEPTVASVRVWINFLRQKLEKVGAGDLIQTIPGYGYMIRAD
jgi:OmpR-family two-component system manganese-sensing response regulator